MPHKRLKPEYNFNEDQLRSLKQIVPEAFADGQINWEILKEALGEYLEEDGPDSEHFGLFWPGKKQARRLAGIPSKGTLVPVYGDGLKADGTPDKDGINDSHNIFIEGENLEVLKILQKSYAGRIKMIYIDPPYNTGNDFIYEDDFSEPLQEYLRRTGQVDEEGRPLTTNTRADGRFHSKWLSMMYPRLRLASNLLRDDGVIFVSIDDNEMPHLRSIMNEIFGEENFVASIIWRGGKRNAAKHISISHEYILFYAKNLNHISVTGESWKVRKKGISEIYKKVENLKKEYNNNYEKISDNLKKWFDDLSESNPIKDHSHYCKVDKKGIYFFTDISREGGGKYDIISPITGNKVKNPTRGWVWGDEKDFWIAYQNDDIVFSPDDNLPSLKRYLHNNEDQILDTVFYKDRRAASISFRRLMGDDIFDFPKDPDILKEYISSTTNNDSIVLDFFAGSGTIAEAVLDLNKENQSKLKYILVQLPEPCDEKSEAFKAGYDNITEIAKERIRRVVKKLNNESNNAKKSKQHKIDFKENSNALIQDFGFKVFKLQESNYKLWKNYQGVNIKELEDLFDNSQSPLVDNWKPEKLLSEILLIEGFPLDSKLEQVTVIKKNKVIRVTSDFHEHSLLVCLDSEIADDTIKKLNLTGDDIFICLDNAVSDQDKVRLADKGMIKTI